MSAGQRFTRSVDAFGSPEIGLEQLPPSPPTTVAVIESIATGAPQRVVSQAAAADQVAALFDLVPSSGNGLRGCSRRRGSTPAGWRSIRRIRIRCASPTAGDDPRTDEPVLRPRGSAGRRRRRARPGPHGDGVDEIGLLVFVTSTGFIAPGVDVALVKQLGLSPSVSRVVVNFMGCAAAMNGLRTATDYVRCQPRSKALVVCIELCSVNAVFADDINDVIISQPVRRWLRGGGHRGQPGPASAGGRQGGDPQ